MKELVDIEKGKRKYKILQKERAIDEAQKAKNRSAIMAGLCMLGAVVAVYFNGHDINQVLQTELNAIYSWDALGQYLQNLGPLTTILAAGTGGFLGKYFYISKKQKKVKNEIEDLNTAFENNNDYGDDENVKTR